MSVKKKVVWLPYDMDTAIGINNDGQLVFDYRLEDIDHQQGGAPIFNGQDSVIWKNIRAAFPDELATMYRNLRSSGALSYEVIENAFEEHQGKWTEAIFNEDAQFKYINPFIESNANYLYMLLGSKEEQRKWWLYNRFRYIDSKYVAGDARNDSIFLRPYAAANITVRPYADIYATVAWDATITQERAARNTTVTLICPYQQMNGNIVNIYSASQLADVGDLSPLKVGQIDISSATRLQALKVGDASSSYDNFNLYSMSFGNNVLLKTVDVRNCSGFGDTTMQGHTQTTVDLSGCSIIENVYFEGTKIAGVSLPNGGVLKILHLPKTITNLTVLNQRALTSFEIEDDDYSSITTLRVENSSNLIPVDDILAEMPANSRVRLIGFSMTVSTTDEVEDFYDYLDTMRGLDEAGNNLDTAVVSGTITGLNTITGAWYSAMKARYPYIQIEYQHISSNVYFYNGSTLLTTVSVNDGGNAIYSGSTPTKAQDAQYTYSFVGWSKDNDNTVDSDALTAVVADRNVYACYSNTLRKYTITWKNSNGTTLETDNNVPYGTTPTYNGSTPVDPSGNSSPFVTWTPAVASVTGNATYTATYKPVYTVTFKSQDGATTLQTKSVVQGNTATYTGTTPTNADQTTFLGWSNSMNSSNADATLTNIQSNKTVYAAFESLVEIAEITDSWDTIIASIDAGTYKTKYKLGNYKPLDLGTEGTINMQIVAMDADELADGSGTAPMTFVGMELPATKAYSGSKFYRDTIQNNVLNAINTNYSSLIPRLQSVVKYSSSYETSLIQDGDVENRKIWILSLRELTGSTNAETKGVTYTNVYRTPASRQKHLPNVGESTHYWTRSLINATKYFFIKDDGTYTYASSTSRNICIGFCLGLEQETISDSWETILANPNYATDYSIGDTKYLDLGTEGKQLMEIVAFDEDDKADGSGKAKITWISKTLLKTRKKMDAKKWSESTIRSYLNSTAVNLVPSEVKSSIVAVTKISNTSSSTTVVNETTVDTLWIPSAYELGGSRETEGATYRTYYNSNEKRKKRNSYGNTVTYPTRSVFKGVEGYFIACSNDGNIENYVSKNDNANIALGFCTD